MNMKVFGLAGLATGVIALFATSTFAHHSHAMFDFTRTVELVGTVTEFQWTNPHSWLRVMAANEQGEMVEYAIEMGAPGALFRRGWRTDTVVAGDEITVSIYPTTNGSNGGTLDSVTLPDGKALVEEYD